MAPTSYRGVIEQARRTLSRLADAPPVASAASVAADELEVGWRHMPFSIGLGGPEVVARTELVNLLCGARALDPEVRSLGSPAVRLHRGPHTRFRVVRDDGSAEEQTMPTEADDDPRLRETVERARAQLDQHRRTHDAAERALPAIVKTRPRWWLVWQWIMRWIWTWTHRNELDAPRREAITIRHLETELVALEQRLAAAEAVARQQRQRYFDRLRAASAAENVAEIEVELSDGQLPEGIELIELTGATRASAAVDAVVLVSRDAMYAPATADRGPVRIGELTDSIAALPLLLESSRSLRLGRRVRDRADAAVRRLDELLASAEEGFRDRIARLEMLRIAEPAQFVAKQISRVRPQIVTSVHSVMEHASVHVGAALEEVASGWLRAIEAARTGDELKAAAAGVDAEWTAATSRIVEEAQILVMGGVNGCGHDLYPSLASGLGDDQLPDDPDRSAPRSITIHPIDVLPSLAVTLATKRGGVGQWLTGLLRSLEAKRAQILEHVRGDIERLRERANVDLLDVEPRLHTALGQELASRLKEAVNRRMTRIDRAVARERAAIAVERQALAPLVETRADVGRELALLSHVLENLERELPACAAAATAALSMSGAWTLGTIEREHAPTSASEALASLARVGSTGSVGGVDGASGLDR
ncbi:MAG: hypothetical protein AB7P03_27280 [Kofleriaceae bacterium]